jgi:hypothetical protein
LGTCQQLKSTKFSDSGHTYACNNGDARTNSYRPPDTNTNTNTNPNPIPNTNHNTNSNSIAKTNHNARSKTLSL